MSRVVLMFSVVIVRVILVPLAHVLMVSSVILPLPIFIRPLAAFFALMVVDLAIFACMLMVARSGNIFVSGIGMSQH